MINSYVLPAVDAWISRLLDVDDSRRPTAAEAAAELHEVLAATAATAVGSVLRRAPHRINYPHVVRDPVHRDIRLTGYEYAILNMPEMQRLRGIKQLGLTYTVYPGTTHTRLSHSIGCVARAARRPLVDGVQVDAAGVESQRHRAAVEQPGQPVREVVATVPQEVREQAGGDAASERGHSRCRNHRPLQLSARPRSAARWANILPRARLLVIARTVSGRRARLSCDRATDRARSARPGAVRPGRS